MRAATLASGTPVTLETNGTVREARGFTSRMKMPRPSRGHGELHVHQAAHAQLLAPGPGPGVLIASTVSDDSE